MQIQADIEKDQEGFSKYYSKLSAEHQKLIATMKNDGFSFMLKVADPNSSIHNWIRKKTLAYTPAIPAPDKLKPIHLPLTFGNVIKCLDSAKADHDFKLLQEQLKKVPVEQLEKNFDGLYEVANAVEDQPKITCKEWLKNLKTSAVEGGKEFLENAKKLSFWAKAIKGALFAGATAYMAINLIQNYKDMSTLSIWMSSLQLGCIAADLLAGKGGRWLLTKIYSVWDWGRKGTGYVVAWLSNTVIDKAETLGRR